MSITLAGALLNHTNAPSAVANGVSAFCNTLLGAGPSASAATPVSTTTTSNTGTSSPATAMQGFTDQLQAMLVQMQSGNTTGAGQASSDPTSQASLLQGSGMTTHHHGHHHHAGGAPATGDNASDLQGSGGTPTIA